MVPTGRKVRSEAHTFEGRGPEEWVTHNSQIFPEELFPSTISGAMWIVVGKRTGSGFLADERFMPEWRRDLGIRNLVAYRKEEMPLDVRAALLIDLAILYSADGNREGAAEALESLRELLKLGCVDSGALGLDKTLPVLDAIQRGEWLVRDPCEGLAALGRQGAPAHLLERAAR
jgi:hypothetical protein